MKHTFLFEEGVWEIEGTYNDERNRTIVAKGETKVTHKKDNWIVENELNLKREGREPLSVRNTYTAVPFKENSDYSSWVSDNEYIGKLKGIYVVIGDTIISSYTAEHGDYIGTDVMLMVSEKKYRNRGCLVKGNRKISSWVMELTKKL